MKKFLPLVFIALVFMAYRILSYSGVDFPINSTPLAGLFLCAVLYAGMRGAIIASLVWVCSYPVLSMLQGYDVTDGLRSSVIGFVLIVAFSFLMKKSVFTSKPKLTVLGGSLIAAVGFYFITNFFSWLGMPIYEKNLLGFYQAQWSGHPSLELPTWVFLRNSLVGNAGFALCILLAQMKWPFASFSEQLKEAR